MEKLGDLFKKKAPKKEMRESEEELPPNVVRVKTENGIFRIAYASHNTERQPKELGNSDAWILESSVAVDYTLPKNQSEEQFEEFRRGVGLVSGDIEYKRLFEKVEKGGTPIFLVDIAKKDTTYLLQKSLQYLEPFVGVWILSCLLAKGTFREKELTRREFLKKPSPELIF